MGYLKTNSIEQRNITPLKVKRPVEWKTNPKGMIERMIENMFNRDFNK